MRDWPTNNCWQSSLFELTLRDPTHMHTQNLINVNFIILPMSVSLVLSLINLKINISKIVCNESEWLFKSNGCKSFPLNFASVSFLDWLLVWWYYEKYEPSHVPLLLLASGTKTHDKYCQFHNNNINAKRLRISCHYGTCSRRRYRNSRQAIGNVIWKYCLKSNRTLTLKLPVGRIAGVRMDSPRPQRIARASLNAAKDEDWLEIEMELPGRRERRRPWPQFLKVDFERSFILPSQRGRKAV